MYDCQPILDFWFGQLDRNRLPSRAHQKRWFSGGSQFDREIRDRFSRLVREVAGGGLNQWLVHGEGYLAQILVLDQFSRHIFRATAAAFKNDGLALGLSCRGRQSERDEGLPPVYRAFFYMPYQHSERLDDQAEAVRLYEQLVEGANAAERKVLNGFARSAREHREIIARFGRFPHRNRVLRRASTKAEKDYLANSGKRFGQ